jgi:UDP-2,3-diacylglucosamine hydrolase
MEEKNGLIFVADPHIESKNEQKYFLRFLQYIKVCKNSLYILGDLFSIWIGTFKRDYHRSVIDYLENLKNSGIKIGYVEGNRDYQIAKKFKGIIFNEADDIFLEEYYAGKRVYISHGDLVNIKDKQYRLWRLLSKNRISSYILNIFPKRLSRVMANKIERILRKTNIKHKSYFPEEECKYFSKELFLKGYDIVILGHFHREEIIKIPIDGKEKIIYTLPDWKTTHRYLFIDKNGNGEFRDFL